MMTMIKDLVQDALDAVFNEAEDADAVVKATKDIFVTENERFCLLDADGSQQTGGGEETGPTKEKKNR